MLGRNLYVHLYIVCVQKEIPLKSFFGRKTFFFFVFVVFVLLFFHYIHFFSALDQELLLLLLRLIKTYEKKKEKVYVPLHCNDSPDLCVRAMKTWLFLCYVFFFPDFFFFFFCLLLFAKIRRR